ncbi:hypothetical protein Tco_1098333 [Tanacetum coccineum]
MRNDFRCLLVYCGRDIAIGRCASKRKLKGVNLTSTGQNEKTPTKGKGKGKGIADNEKTPTKGKGKGIADESQPESANTPTKWTKERIKRVKDTPSSHYCTFRLWASWMSSEKSFQIKSLYPDYKCSWNYNIGSLVTYKWIASHYAKEIINNLLGIQKVSVTSNIYDLELDDGYGATINFRRTKIQNGLDTLRCQISDHHVSRFGRPITCQNCWERCHNKGSCKNPSRPKPPSDIQRPMKRKLGGSSVPGKGDSTGPSKETKGVQGNKGGPSKATKGVQGNKGGPSKAKKCMQGNKGGPSKEIKGVQGNKGGPSKAKKGVQGKGKKVCHKGGINISEGQHMTPSQEELFRQDQVVLEEVIHEEERQKEMEWERNGRTYATWSDVERYNQDDPWEDERSPDDMQLFRYSDVSAHEVQASSEAQAHGVQAPTAVQAAHEVQASSEAQAHGVQAPTAVQAAHEVQAPSQTSIVAASSQTSSRVVRPTAILRPRSQRIASKRKLNYVNDGTGNTPDKPVNL